MDTSGKDGTVKHVSAASNPKACAWPRSRRPPRRSSCTTTCGGCTHGRRSTVSFSACSTARTTRTCSWSGCTTSCRRRCGERYDQINAFEEPAHRERHDDREGVPPHLQGRAGQALQARLDNPDKNWKFNKGDLAERALWDDYQRAYEDAIGKTSTKHARGICPRRPQVVPELGGEPAPHRGI